MDCVTATNMCTRQTDGRTDIRTQIYRYTPQTDRLTENILSIVKLIFDHHSTEGDLIDFIYMFIDRSACLENAANTRTSL